MYKRVILYNDIKHILRSFKFSVRTQARNRCTCKRSERIFQGTQGKGYNGTMDH